MKRFDSSKWITENKYGKLSEDADPTKQDDERFPTKLSQVDKSKATAYSDQGDFDGEKDDDTISKESSSWPVSALKPSQTSMNIGKGLAFALGMIKGDNPGGDLDAFISSDMHIMDGHHRWIASGMVDPTSDLGGHKLNYPAMKLIAVLNTLTKGEFNVQKGKEATGGFDQFKVEPITAKLEEYLTKGVGDAMVKDKDTGEMSPNEYRMEPEEVQAAIEKFTGVQGEGAKQAAVNKFVENLSSLKFDLPDRAGGREDMPVVDKGDVQIALDKITTGDVDVNPPYGDGKTSKTGLGESEPNPDTVSPESSKPSDEKVLGDVELVIRNIDKINTQQELQQILKKIMDHISAGNVTGGSFALNNALGTTAASAIKKEFGIKEAKDPRYSLYEQLENHINKNLNEYVASRWTVLYREKGEGRDDWKELDSWPASNDGSKFTARAFAADYESGRRELPSTSKLGIEYNPDDYEFTTEKISRSSSMEEKYINK